ncbi:Gfo/Idh/MocA family oxidoreductase [Enterococcus sp. LJL99]
MKKMIMAIVGYGKSAKRYHLPFIELRKEIQVKYICDPALTSEDIAMLKNEGIKATLDLAEMLADEEVKLVTLCTPPKTHFTLAEICLLAGKNVVVEKPFCENIQETEHLLALAKEKNLVIMPFQNRRFDSDFLTLKKVIERNYLGELVELEAHIDYYRPNHTERIGTKLDGSFYGLGIHAVDQAIALFGKPNKVTYDIRNVQTIESTVDDYYELQLFYDRLKVILKSSQIVAKSGPRYRLIGLNGVYEKYGVDQQENDLKLGIKPGNFDFGVDVPDLYGTVRYQNANGDWIEKTIKSELGDYGRFYDEIYQVLNKGKASFIKENEIFAVMTIMDEALP